MKKYDAIDDIAAVIVDRSEVIPTVVRWNRLEGRPRADDFGRALRAEVRDPLWMLGRQWQVGEFRGDDAGSPVTARLSWVSDPVTTLHTGGGADLTLDGTAPLETLLEQRPIPAAVGGHPISLDIRLAAGRRWVKLLRAAGLDGLEDEFRIGYPVTAPDPVAEDDYVVTAHPPVWQTFAAVAGRVVDGYDLYLHLTADPGNRPSDGLGLTEPDGDAVNALGPGFVAWFARLFHRPAGPAEDSWAPPHLEYAAGLTVDASGDGSATLVADEHHGGPLDWYSVDATGTGGPADPADRRTVSGFLPTGARFDGMPNTRWWTFEEGRVNFGDVQPDTTDLAKLLLVEFGLVYGNDWFLAPLTAPAGAVTRVEGLAVTNVFGERLWIEPAAARDESWRRWSMFGTTDRRGGIAPGLVLLPTAPGVLEGATDERVLFVRDEVANLVWAIETTVPMPDGSSRRGREAATELHRRYQDALAAGTPGEPPNDAPVHYRLATSVDENWIPFIGVHIPGDVREIQLRRASMPRLLAGATGTPERVRPRTTVLRPGLDGEVPEPYLVFEEEVSRAGESVSCGWRRARGTDGRVHLWRGMRRQAGRGEASSGLAFDRAV
ncbi:hypothetical protein [Actinoplanes solisilvae]|uniref:hypothetical protein n=1 Tax=Actinoplanes solisilvae TaxID=2486853 RepID=UPI000FD8D0AE|nr:hypothetical protein [Actinoplanes solisilvae]